MLTIATNLILMTSLTIAIMTIVSNTQKNKSDRIRVSHSNISYRLTAVSCELLKACTICLPQFLSIIPKPLNHFILSFMEGTQNCGGSIKSWEEAIYWTHFQFIHFTLFLNITHFHYQLVSTCTFNF